jgi:hypothetical protein
VIDVLLDRLRHAEAVRLDARPTGEQDPYRAAEAAPSS